MPSFPSPFGSDDDDLFDGYDEFVAADLPRPGEFLDGHDVLDGADHLAFHRLTRDCFEERKVYDMTFNYNLARLNLDTRHGNAGFRYAVERGDPADAVGPADVDGDAVGDDGPEEGDLGRVLRAEFTPTTPFCPQTHTLTIGSFRAWNGLAERHEYDLVRVRAAPMHNQSEAVNDRLVELEEAYLETGDVESESDDGAGVGPNPTGGTGEASARSRSTDAPF
ncbi:hypothetical protein J2744_000303 [Halorubrum trapanicum]|uniref:DUF7998 domain-containing protein n=1 Tax=Halorubrum trapanicum TaxID=29284 RepID=A0A8J7R4C3_9EURY|nr:hypothetical protein [Halorubrum trapanicum]MBP1900651.1 hypothetical protein [Halorubrum trapanicum]